MNRNHYYHKSTITTLFTVIAGLMIIIVVQQYKLWTADDIKIIRHIVQSDGTHTVEFSYRDTIETDSLTDYQLDALIKGIKLPIDK